MRNPLKSIVLILGSLLLATVAHSATSTWTLTGAGAWGQALNWSGGVPGATSNVTITQSATTVTNSSNVTITGLTLTGGTISFSSTTNITASGYYLLQGGTANVTLAGNVALTKNSTTSATLSRANTYTGGTILNAGTLVLGNALSLGTGSLTINATTSPAPTLDATSNLTVGNAETWSSSFTFNGSHALTLSGPVALTANDTVTVSAGILTVGSLGNSISGAFGLTEQGNGTLVLAGANTYTGNTSLVGGTLSLGNATALGSGNLSITGGTLDASTPVTVSNKQIWGGNFSFAGSNALTMAGNATLSANRTLTISAGTLAETGVITGNFAINKQGLGTLVLGGNNTYTGTTTISQGNLSIQSNTALGTTANATTVLSGATLQIQGGITSAEPLTLNGTGSASNGVLENVSGTNTLSGTVTLSGGSSLFTADAGGNVTLTGPVNGAGQNLTVGGLGGVSVAGVIGTTTGSLIKNDAGTLTLSAGNTYSGGTTLNSGILFVSHANGMGASGSNVTINGGTLQMGGSQGYYITGNTGNIIVNSALSIAFPLNYSGNISIPGAFNLTLSGGAGVASTIGNVTMANGSQITPSANVTVAAGSTLQALGNATVSGAYALLNAVANKLGVDSLGDPVDQSTIIQGPSGAGQSLQFQSSLNGASDMRGNIAIINAFAPSPSSTTAGLTNIYGTTTLNSSGTLMTMQIGGTSRGVSGGYDAINLKNGGVFNLNGTLTIKLINGYAPVVGDTFQLFRKVDVAGGSGSLVGSFSAFDFSNAALGAGLQWDTSNLYSSGILDVLSSVPEPSLVAVIFGGMALGLAVVRRRSRTKSVA